MVATGQLLTGVVALGTAASVELGGCSLFEFSGNDVTAPNSTAVQRAHIFLRAPTLRSGAAVTVAANRLRGGGLGVQFANNLTVGLRRWTTPCRVESPSTATPFRFLAPTPPAQTRPRSCGWAARHTSTTAETPPRRSSSQSQATTSPAATAPVRPRLHGSSRPAAAVRHSSWPAVTVSATTRPPRAVPAAAGCRWGVCPSMYHCQRRPLAVGACVSVRQHRELRVGAADGAGRVPRADGDIAGGQPHAALPPRHCRLVHAARPARRRCRPRRARRWRRTRAGS